MTDIVDKQTRSRMMSGIRDKNTRPEMMIRKALFREGFRYRLHAADMPGKPDLVLPRYNAVIFVNGCFWHGHDCHLFKWPNSRKQFWRDKIRGNQARDLRNRQQLEEAGWLILIIWECALKGKTRRPFDQVVSRTANWLRFGTHNAEIRGKLTR